MKRSALICYSKHNERNLYAFSADVTNMTLNEKYIRYIFCILLFSYYWIAM